VAGKGSKKKRPPAKRPPAKAAGTPQKAAPAKPGTPAGAAATPQKAAPAKAAPDGGARRSKPTQAERLQAARQARRRKALRVRLGVAAGVLALVALVVTLVAADKREDRAEEQRLTAGSCDYDTRADRLTANNHVPPARYEVDPPAGGDHDPGAVPANVFPEGGSLPTDAQLVHSLEHGFVVLWHQPGLTEAETADIRAVFDEHAEDVIVVPRPSLGVKVAATSWGRRLLCGEVERDSLSEFVDLYRNKSPEAGVR
jgi:hypothetical protein